MSLQHANSYQSVLSNSSNISNDSGNYQGSQFGSPSSFNRLNSFNSMNSMSSVNSLNSPLPSTSLNHSSNNFNNFNNFNQINSPISNLKSQPFGTPITHTPSTSHTLTPNSLRSGSQFDFHSANTLIDFSNHIPNTISQRVDTLFRNHTLNVVQQNLQSVQNELSEAQNDLKRAVQDKYTQLVNFTANFYKMHQCSENISNLLKFSLDFPVQESNQETNILDFEDEPEDYYYIINQLIQEDMQLHATLFMNQLFPQNKNRNVPARQWEMKMFSNEILSKIFTIQECSTEQWRVDLDICQKFLSFVILSQGDSSFSNFGNHSNHSNHANSGDIDKIANSSNNEYVLESIKHGTQLSLVRQFLDFQLNRIKCFGSVPKIDEPTQFGAFIIFNYIFSFVISYSLFCSNKFEKKCKDINTLLRHIVKSTCRNQDFVQYYNDFLYQLIEEKLQHNNFDSIISFFTSKDSKETSLEQIESELQSFYQNSLPYLEEVLRSILDKCDTSNIESCYILQKTYDQIVYILNTCHIRLHQHSHFFDSLEISQICEKPFMKTVISSIPKILEKLYLDKQSYIIQDTLQEASKEILITLEDSMQQKQNFTPYISSKLTTFKSNTTSEIHSHLWESKDSEKLLLSRFQLKSKSSQNDPTFNIESNTFDSIVKDTINKIFNNILQKRLKFILILFKSNEKSISNIRNASLISTIYSNLINCIQNSIFKFVELKISNFQKIDDSHDLEKIDKTELNTSLLLGRLIQEFETSFLALSKYLEGITAQKIEFNTIISNLNLLYVQSHSLWLQFVSLSFCNVFKYASEFYLNNSSLFYANEQEFIPYKPSILIQESIQLLNDQLYNLGSYKTKNSIVPKISETISFELVQLFEKLLLEIDNQLKEYVAIQILFDLRIFALVLFQTPIDKLQNKKIAENSNLSKNEQLFLSLIEKVQSHIDAINWETIENQFESNLKDHLQSHHLNYGLFSGYHINDMKGNVTNQRQFIEIAPSMGAPFQLLTVNKIGNIKDTMISSTKENDQITSRITSFFKGFGW